VSPQRVQGLLVAVRFPSRNRIADFLRTFKSFPNFPLVLPGEPSAQAFYALSLCISFVMPCFYVNGYAQFLCLYSKNNIHKP
jgi:hypothetical protein